MCGISGIIEKTDKKVNPDQLKEITDIILHRGPDGGGFYYGGNFAFGHRRLSIIDLSEKGHQPMHYMDKYVITYNGEVYNYIELRKELIASGYSFESDTDTEVILAAYDKWGKDCVNYFNGMWAFAIFDKEKNIIFCSRDRFGVKPFYYTEIDDKFIFGSEIKQLLCFFENRTVNKTVLIDYLVYGFSDHTAETFFKNVFSLPGSHNLIYNLETHDYIIEKYYELSFNHDLSAMNETESVEKFKNEFFRSITYRLRSDVQVGTCLSGGLDSSSVAAVASGIYNKNSASRFNAIHARSTEKDTDESIYASIVAEDKDINLHIITPTTNDFISSLKDVFYTQEEPFGSPSICMQYFVMKKAKELDCKVMLDGQGGG